MTNIEISNHVFLCEGNCCQCEHRNECSHRECQCRIDKSMGCNGCCYYQDKKQRRPDHRTVLFRTLHGAFYERRTGQHNIIFNFGKEMSFAQICVALLNEVMQIIKSSITFKFIGKKTA